MFNYNIMTNVILPSKFYKITIFCYHFNVRKVISVIQHNVQGSEIVILRIHQSSDLGSSRSTYSSILSHKY